MSAVPGGGASGRDRHTREPRGQCLPLARSVEARPRRAGGRAAVDVARGPEDRRLVCRSGGARSPSGRRRFAGVPLARCAYTVATKQAILESDGHDTLVADIPDVANGQVWPGAYVRVRRNPFIEEWRGRGNELRRRAEVSTQRRQAGRPPTPITGPS